MKLSDYVMQFVAAQGVRHVFMLPGGGAMHRNQLLGRCEGLEFVSNLHEQAAAIAAEAYAKVTNGLGVALVTSGPGGTNALTGFASAWLDSVPCLMISGQVKRADLKRDFGVRMLGVQEIDIVSIVEPIAKYAVRIDDPASIRLHLEKATDLARRARPGPVWIDIPLDVQAAQIDHLCRRSINPDRRPTAAAPGDAGRSVGRPASDVGATGDRRRKWDPAGRSSTTVSAAGRRTWPAGADDLARDGLVAEAHPLFAGRPGSIAPRGANFALQNSDLMIVIGARLDMALTGYAHDKLARDAVKVMVDIDPAEIGKMQTEVRLPIVADAAEFLTALSMRLPGHKPGSYGCGSPNVRRGRSATPSSSQVTGPSRTA